jgi:hypothetical protein
MLEEFAISEAQKWAFSGTALLDHLARREPEFDPAVPGRSADLTPLCQWLEAKGYVEPGGREGVFRLSDRGLGLTKLFAQRYSLMLSLFDVFCAVDLGEGEFAMARFREFPDEASWRLHLSDERWEDLRVPVLDHEDGDPIDFVFMQFAHQDRLGIEADGWEAAMLDGRMWEGIAEVCNGALEVEDLGFEQDGKLVEGETVLDEVIERGFEIVRDLCGGEPEVIENLDLWDADQGKEDSPRPVWLDPWKL